MILPFVPTPEDMELKINIKEAEQVIDLANDVVKNLNSKWDPDTNHVPVYYSTSKYNRRVVQQVIDAFERSGWKATSETSGASSSESAYINISKKLPPAPPPQPKDKSKNNLELD